MRRATRAGIPRTVDLPFRHIAVATPTWLHLTLQLAARAVRSPSLVLALLVVAWRFRDRHWFRRFPFLPLPSRAYVRWRMHTAYGSGDAIPPVDDVVRYARWAAR